MGLMDNLPSQAQFDQILKGVVGDGSTGTGVAGVLRLLEQVDAKNLSANVSASLGQSVSANIGVDMSGLTGGAMTAFQGSLAAFPSDPSSLVGPLAARLGDVRGLSTDALKGQLGGGIAGLHAVEDLVPPDLRSLIAGAADSMGGVKGEFISGAFGELRQWSQQLDPLLKEIEPLIAGGPGTLEERLLAWLKQKVAALLAQILPPEVARIPQFVAQVDATVKSPLAARIPSLKTDLAAAMDRARVEFEAGNFSNTLQFQAARSAFDALVQALSGLASTLGGLVDGIGGGLGDLLKKQYDHLLGIEIVDVGNIRDRFASAIAKVEDLLKGLNLDAVRQKVDDLFGRIEAAVDKFKLPNLLDQVTGLKSTLEGLLSNLDAGLFEAVATIRDLFNRLRDALRGVLQSLGSFDAGGKFHFAVQDQIESFLNGVRTTLDQRVRPVLEQLRTTVRGALEQVKAGLESLRGEIDKVKTQLQQALQGVLDQLRSVDVAGTMQRIRGELDGMLGSLGEIDFDVVADPVIAQLNEFRDTLAGIDVSSLNEFTVGALKVSVQFAVKLDFSAQITGVLMAEIDKILQVPKDALAEVEATVNGALKAFGALAPQAILAPLDNLFAPVKAALDALDLQALLKPLDDWYDGLLKTLGKVSPASLLAPLVSLHADLLKAFDAISPEALVRPLRELVAGLKTQIQQVNLGSVADELGGLAAKVRGLLEQIAPDRLLNPLVDAFDKVMGALDSFDPAVLLEPLKGLFAAITAPLENLTADNAALVAKIFAPLRDLIGLFDPRALFARLATAFGAIRDLLAQVNVGGLIADLNTPFSAMHAAFEAHGGGADVSLSASVDGINPLRNADLAAAATRFRDLQTRLDALAAGTPPDDLVRRYEADVKPVIDKIIPVWARDNITAASMRRAFQLINPLSLEDEIRALYAALKDKLRVFDPRQIQERLHAVFEKLLANLDALSPDKINAAVRTVLSAVTDRLDALNLDLIFQEITGVSNDVRALLDALNPQPVIDQLQGLVDEVMSLAAELKPSTLLAELDAPFQAARQIVLEFDPAVFVAALQDVFKAIQDLLAQIDVGVLLEPLVKKLQDLRDALQAVLERVEAAFNAMVKAIPV